MPIWIPITFAAAFMQTIRFMLQKHLRGAGLSSGGTTLARFIYASPLALALALVVTAGPGWPGMNAKFWVFACGGGLGQILGTLATVSLFTRRNFAVGIAFTKTETVQVVAFSAIVLGEAVSALGLVAILTGVAGILVLSRPPKGSGGRFLNMATLLGVVAGAAFGVSAIGYRGAALALEDGGFFLRAVVTLACVTTFQTLVMVVMLAIREPGEVRRVLSAWRVAGLVGVTGMLGSLGWFTAFTLQNAAYVRAVGQVEMVFTIIAAHLVFRERITSREFTGIALIVASLVLLILSL